MKRIGNLFNRIISYENLVRADKKARLGKTKRYGVKKFDRNPYENLVRLQKALIEDTYRTSECAYTQSSPIVVIKKERYIGYRIIQTE